MSKKSININKPPGIKGDWTPSFWLSDLKTEERFLKLEYPSEKNYDLIIVGGGVTGLSAAHFAKEKNPKLKILVIERGLYPAGATISSAGFATIGSISEILMYEEKENTEAIIKLTHRKLKGLRLLEKINSDAIDFEVTGDLDIFGTAEKDLFEKSADNLERLNKALLEETGEKDVFSIVDSEISRYGINAEHLILNRLNGYFHPGKMLENSFNRLISNGVEIARGLNAISVKPGHLIAESSSGDTFETKSSKILITTNAYASELFSDLSDIKPGRAQAMVTTPIKNLTLDRPCHIREGYDYARPLVDKNGNGRILIGGGRDLDFQKETTLESGTTDLAINHIKKTLQEVLLPGLELDKDYEIAQIWSGHMGFGPQSAPRIKELESGVYCAVGLSGMGLAIGSLVGLEAVDMILDS